MAKKSLGQLLNNADILQQAAKLTQNFDELNTTILQILRLHLDKVSVEFAPNRPHDWFDRFAVLQIKYGGYILRIPVPELKALDKELAEKVRQKMNAQQKEVMLQQAVQEWLDYRGQSEREFAIDPVEGLNNIRYAQLAETDEYTSGRLTLELYHGQYQVYGGYDKEFGVTGNVLKPQIWQPATHPEADKINTDKWIEALRAITAAQYRRTIAEAIELAQAGKIVASALRANDAVGHHAKFVWSDDPQIRALFDWAKKFDKLSCEDFVQESYDDSPLMRIRTAGFPEARLWFQEWDLYREAHLAFKEGNPIVVKAFGRREGLIVRWEIRSGYMPKFPKNISITHFNEWMESFQLADEAIYEDMPITFKG